MPDNSTDVSVVRGIVESNMPLIYTLYPLVLEGNNDGGSQHIDRQYESVS